MSLVADVQTNAKSSGEDGGKKATNENYGEISFLLDFFLFHYFSRGFIEEDKEKVNFISCLLSSCCCRGGKMHCLRRHTRHCSSLRGSLSNLCHMEKTFVP
jgi:hypothetical protein